MKFKIVGRLPRTEIGRSVDVAIWADGRHVGLATMLESEWEAFKQELAKTDIEVEDW